EGPHFVRDSATVERCPEEILPHVDRRASPRLEEDLLVEPDAVTRVPLSVVEEAAPHAFGEAHARLIRPRHIRRADRAFLKHLDEPLGGSECSNLTESGNLMPRVPK